MSLDDKFSLGKSKLLQDEPFYAFLAQRCAMILTKEVKTISIKEKAGTFYLLYNPEWIDSLPLEKVAGAIKHCLNHLIFNHLEGADTEDQKMGLAQDLAVNSCLKKSELPEGFMHPDDMGLPPDKSTFEYYNMLPEFPQCPSGGSGDGNGNGDKEGKGFQKPGDDHSFMKSESRGSQLQKQVTSMVGDAKQEAGKLPSGWGNGLSHYIDSLLRPPKIPWRSILRKFPAMSAKTDKRKTWKRPNRRFGEMQQGWKKFNRMFCFVAIDESGSISDRDLNEFLSEMVGIYKTNPGRILICKFTSQVEKVFEFKGVNDDMKHRFSGGTLFQPFFKEAEKHKPDCVIVFTDGYNFDNPCKYSNPNRVLWVLTSDGSMSETFGTQVKIDHEEEITVLSR